MANAPLLLIQSKTIEATVRCTIFPLPIVGRIVPLQCYDVPILRYSLLPVTFLIGSITLNVLCKPATEAYCLRAPASTACTHEYEKEELLYPR